MSDRFYLILCWDVFSLKICIAVVCAPDWTVCTCCTGLLNRQKIYLLASYDLKRCPGPGSRLIGVLSHVLKVVGLITGQGTYLGCGFDCLWDSWSGCIQKQPINASLALMFLSLSLKKQMRKCPQIRIKNKNKHKKNQ